jgi:triacylglycerol lipase
LVAWNDDVTVIAFRGTNLGEGADWIVNLNFVFTNDADRGMFHPGFAGAYAPMKDEVELLVGVARPKYLWITGHSLGGALAAICAFEMTERNIGHVTDVMTFGQPMVGNLQLAEQVHQV